MSRKSRKIVVLVACMVIFQVGSVYGTDITWDGEADDDLWSSAENWEGDVVPGSADGAIIRVDGSVVIEDGVEAVASYSNIGSNGGVTLTQTGGSLTMASWQLCIGEWGSHNATYNLSGGSVSADNVWIGDWGNAYLHMTGGVMNVTWDLKIARNGGSGHVQLDGGTIYAETLSIVGGRDAHLDITGDGQLVLGGNDDMSWYIGSGYLTANGVPGDVLVNYDGTNTIVSAVPEPASMVLLALGSALFLRKRRE